MIHRIVSTEESEQMPPDKSLNQKEINTLKAWISEGAKWPKHWSYSTLHVKTEMGSTIDQIISFKLKEIGLNQNKIAISELLLDDCHWT